MLWWSLGLDNDVLWVENVLSKDFAYDWGTKFNAAQFTKTPLQRRRRYIGGRYRYPFIYRGFKYDYVEYRQTCTPAVLASEIEKAGLSLDFTKERRKASRYYMREYQRHITIDDMALAQGFDIPDSWRVPLPGYTDRQWRMNLSQGIGNGVPVYMAQAFGDAYSNPVERFVPVQLSLFEGF